MPKTVDGWECDICGKKSQYLPDAWFNLDKQIKGFHNAVFCSATCLQSRVRKELLKYDKVLEKINV